MADNTINKEDRVEALEQAYVEEKDPGAKKTGEVVLESDWGKIRLDISADAMVVTLCGISPVGEDVHVGPEQLLTEVRNAGIVHGIDANALFQIGNQATKGRWSGQTEVARGTPSKSTARLVYPVLDKFEKANPQGAVWKVDNETISFADLDEVLRNDDATSITETEVRVLAVAPGQVLARVEGTEESEFGKDVYGRESQSPELPDLEVGRNVTVTRSGLQFESAAYGFVAVLEGKLTVVPPVWVSPDKMTACLLNLPQVGDAIAPCSEDVAAGLRGMGVTIGIDEEAIQSLCAALEVGAPLPLAVPIAKGEEPAPGSDAYLEFTFDTAKKPGEMREDGSIDLRERNLVNNVVEGNLIAEKVAATAGTVGSNLLGEEIETTDGQDCDVRPGEGCRLDETEDKVRVFATLDGAATHQNGTVAVSPVLRINGDVGYDTGNIEIEKDLYVSGSVQSGFTVDVGGEANIAGVVETDARLHIKGNLTVGNGILGDKTTIVVFGDLRTRFIQNARVLVVGNVEVGSYIHNAVVRCGGTITIQQGGGDRGGSVVGGKITAGEEIVLASAGSPSGPATTIAFDADPESARKMEKLEQGIRFCDQNITKMMRTLELDSFEPNAIKATLDKVPAAKKELFIKIMGKMNELVKHKRKSIEEHESLTAKINANLHRAKLQVKKKLYTGSEIRFGAQTFEPMDDVGPAVIQLIGDGIHVDVGGRG